MSSKDLGKACFVSTATVYRLCDKLNLAGFSDLKIKITSSLNDYLKSNGDFNFDFPVIVKPSRCGSSIGITKANNEKEFKKAVKIAKNYNQKVIVEKFINARELECAVLEDKNLIISNPGEIKCNSEFYDYKAKYKNNNSELIVSAEIEDEIKNKIKNIAKLLFEKLNLNGFARIDFFYDGNNVYINEINTIPGFTKKSMFPKLMENEGISYSELITKLIENAK